MSRGIASDCVCVFICVLGLQASKLFAVGPVAFACALVLAIEVGSFSLHSPYSGCFWVWCRTCGCGAIVDAVLVGLLSLCVGILR